MGVKINVSAASRQPYGSPHLPKMIANRTGSTPNSVKTDNVDTGSCKVAHVSTVQFTGDDNPTVALIREPNANASARPIS